MRSRAFDILLGLIDGEPILQLKRRHHDKDHGNSSLEHGEGCPYVHTDCLDPGIQAARGNVEGGVHLDGVGKWGRGRAPPSSPNDQIFNDGMVSRREGCAECPCVERAKKLRLASI